MNDWSGEIRRGDAMKEQLLQIAGPALSTQQAAELLALQSASEVQGLISQRALLALASERGAWIIPGRQFSPSSRRIRTGLPAVLRAAEDKNAWVILSLLVGPNPLSGQGTALDDLDDPEVAEAMIALIRTYGEQGAS